MTNKEKRDQGYWYDAGPNDKELSHDRAIANKLSFKCNNTLNEKKRSKILKKLIPNQGKNICILSPISIDYGTNVELGNDIFINHNIYFLDCAKIKIGNNVMIGPNCGLYTAIHPLVPAERNTFLEEAKGITIEDDVWFGGNVVVLPGVTIGKGSTIGAGSLVNRDIPPNVLAFGNPIKIIREIKSEEDSIYIKDNFRK